MSADTLIFDVEDYYNKTKHNGHMEDFHDKRKWLNRGEEDEMEIFGYRKCMAKCILTWILYLLTLGILRLVFHWYPQWQLYFTHQRCELLLSEKVLIVDIYENIFKSYFIKDVKSLSIPMFGIQENNNSEYPAKGTKSIRIYLCDGTSKEVTELKVINVKKLMYVWSDHCENFIKLVGLDKGLTNSQLHEFGGFTFEEEFMRGIVYGKNEINVPIQSIWALFVLEALNPFYIFQVFTLCVWFAEAYYYYTCAIIFMSVFGIVSSVIQTRQNQKSLHDTVNTVDKVTVKRSQVLYEEVPTTHLVPGDIIVIPKHGCTMACDATLLQGNCIVNESMLTGESVPVMKTALPSQNQYYNEKEDINHTLYCGTIVLQARYHGDDYLHAVVIRTGFQTAKGALVRSILYPPPADFKFDQDSYKFIWVLATIALCGSMFTIIMKSLRGMSLWDITIKSLDIITIVIPPALPATMTVGKLYALTRLKKHNISCINSRVINVSGSINCVCFDKTGTLTEDGLDMWGVVPLKDKRLDVPIKHIQDRNDFVLLKHGMATCHSLTLINGELSGDPLDLKMFESTGWKLEEPNLKEDSHYELPIPAIVRPPCGGSDTGIEIGLVHQYQFSSTLQRMSIITRQLGSEDLMVFCKGSPEMIQSLSKPDTIPENMVSILSEYTEQGYRVISMACRVLPLADFKHLNFMKRDDIEKDLEFLGLIILENRLKPQTEGVIKELKDAKVKVVMITGDNIQTAISVAKECGIIDPGETVVDVSVVPGGIKESPKVFYTVSGVSAIPTKAKKLNYSKTEEELGLESGAYKFAVTGKAWELIRDELPELIPRLIVKGAIFARMSSDQKQQLVLELQQLGYYVAMCGDGANDCGALRAAHAGISLSEAESSVASPFTSTVANISCVLRIIREGRAALVTSFGIFKFMVLYSLCEFFSTMILYTIDSNLTDFEFLYIDIALVFNFAFFFGRNHAFSGPLTADTPQSSLFSHVTLLSMLFQLILMVSMQIVSFVLVHKFAWFEPFVFTNATSYSCYENYAVFAISMFQYIILAITFSQGKPYRTPIYKNKLFTMSIFAMTLACIYITLYPANAVIQFLQLRFPPDIHFPLLILYLAIGNFVLSLFIENFVIQYLLMNKFKHWNNIKKCKYLAIEHDLDNTFSWPKLSKQAPVIMTSPSALSLCTTHESTKL
uniref:Cation-transporting ATPase n=2 Tax=Cacopsylla melanoneura TaxID=428564 RepID=A0A8D9BL32_9HEMI